MEAIKIGFVINEGTVINSETKDKIAKETNSIELGIIIIVCAPEATAPCKKIILL